MTKGFSKDDQDDEIQISSLVKSRDLTPAVNLKWGRNNAQLSSKEAIEHAFGILEAAISAEVDAALMVWAMQVAKTSKEEAAELLFLYREAREQHQIPSCTLEVGEESIRPETARRRALYLLQNAFNAESEAFIVLFLLEVLQTSVSTVDPMIQELRRLRGLQTDWEWTGVDRD